MFNLIINLQFIHQITLIQLDLFILIHNMMVYYSINYLINQIFINQTMYFIL